MLYQVIDSVNQELPEEMHLEKSPETVLFGSGGKLDSLGLVNLVVAAEQSVADTFGAPVSISDERAMSQKNSPFRTVDTLAEYIALLIGEEKNG